MKVLEDKIKKGRTLRRPFGIVNHTHHPVRYLPTRPPKVLRQGDRVFLKNGMLAPTPSYTPLVYNGGPTMRQTELVSLFWGNFSTAEVNATQSYLRSLADYLSGVGAPPGQAPVLWQYNCVLASVGGSFVDTNAPANADDQDVRNRIIDLQNQGSLPPFAPERLFLVLTKGIAFDGLGTVWCGYHNDIDNGQYYALCPQVTSIAGCGASTAGWQSVICHEVMEAMTDPVPTSGWYDGGAEGGDPCNFQDVTQPFGVIQKFDDNYQQTCAIYTPHVPLFWVDSFNAWPGYAIPNGIWLVGDFDGDGKADIVHAVQDNDYVNVWKSLGRARFDVTSFRPWSGYAIPNGLWLVGDFNGDGKSDIVHAVQDTDYVNFWKSNGDGTFDVSSFSPWDGYAIPNGLWLVGDFDGDGKSDIVHAVEGHDYVNVWKSNGDGTFQVRPFSPWNGYAIPNGLWLVGDFDGDGKSDIVHAVQDHDYVNVWTSIGDGTFDVRSFTPWSGYAIPNGLWLVGDFDGDGKDDLLHVVEGADYANVWLSNGDGTFRISSFRPWDGYAMPNGLWLVGDFNGDGRDEVLHAVQDSDYANLWVSNGDGTFTVTPFSPWPGYAVPNGLWLPGDFNGDGRTDIVHAVQDSDYVNVWTALYPGFTG